MFESRTTCRSCGSDDLHLVLDLGSMPLADALADDDQWRTGEARYPLTVMFCRSCCLVQIRETVPPEVLYCQNYPYYSSFSPALLEHSRANALQLMTRRNLTADSLVVELASNDGYLLKNFVERGIPVLGIDPAEGPATAAVKAGVPTVCAFFGQEMGERMRADGTRADVVIGNNVLAHVADLNGFVAGIAALLKDDGVAVIEAPYVKDLVDHCEFDTIYHEHHCYFSVTSFNALFKRHGLTLQDVEHLPIHGGSLRYYAGPEPTVSATVTRYLADEAAQRLTEVTYYQDFAARVRGIKRDLLDLLTGLRASGKTVAAYGAAAKGATLVNYIGIDDHLVDFVVDRNTHKHGYYMPGVHVPIAPPERLVEERPDYVLMLAWNFREEILRQQQQYTAHGGQWIVPVPHPEVIRA